MNWMLWDGSLNREITDSFWLEYAERLPGP